MGGASANWKLATGLEAAAFDFVEGESSHYLTAIPLSGLERGGRLSLWNYWRTALELSPWTQAEADAAVQSVDVGGTPAAIVEFSSAGPPQP